VVGGKNFRISDDRLFSCKTKGIELSPYVICGDQTLNLKRRKIKEIVLASV
jgi:hypothetical protein